MGKSDLIPTERVLKLRRKERALNTLGNITRLSILYLLHKSKETGHRYNFNQIAEEIGVDKNILAYHLALLKNNHFISDEVRIDEKKRMKFSFYKITETGLKAVDMIEKIDNSDEVDETQLNAIIE